MVEQLTANNNERQKMTTSGTTESIPIALQLTETKAPTSILFQILPKKKKKIDIRNSKLAT